MTLKLCESSRCLPRQLHFVITPVAWQSSQGIFGKGGECFTTMRVLPEYGTQRHLETFPRSLCCMRERVWSEVRASNLFSSRHPGLDSGPCCGHNTGHVDAGNRKVQILIRGVISPLPGVISGVLVTLLSPGWRSREIRVTPLAWVSWCHHQRLILYLVKPSQICGLFEKGAG